MQYKDETSRACKYGLLLESRLNERSSNPTSNNKNTTLPCNLELLSILLLDLSLVFLIFFVLFLFHFTLRFLPVILMCLVRMIVELPVVLRTRWDLFVENGKTTLNLHCGGEEDKQTDERTADNHLLLLVWILHCYGWLNTLLRICGVFCCRCKKMKWWLFGCTAYVSLLLGKVFLWFS